MKKLLLVFVALLVSFMALSGCEKEQEVSEITEPYDYSETEILPGGLLWESLSVPEDVLKKMTTEALVETVQNVPHGELLVITAAYSTNDVFEDFLM